MMGMDASMPGKSALHLTSSISTLEIGMLVESVSERLHVAGNIKSG